MIAKKITKRKEMENDDIILKMKNWVARVKKKQESAHIQFYGSGKGNLTNKEKVMKNEH